jgi:chemotaxis protein methyltransferase CheR
MTASGASLPAAWRAREIEQFLCGIYGRYGYDFRDYSAEATSRRVLEAAQAHTAGSIDDLLLRALSDPAFFERLLPELTVTVTETTRDPEAFSAMREHVLPHLRTYPRVKIWHAGCATGEEAYSMAIMLAEEGMLKRSCIYATDINRRALEVARRGRVPTRDLEAARERHRRAGGRAPLDEYFEMGAEGPVMARALRERIVFAEHDLVHDGSFGEMHLIICRNVLIYFAPPLRERVLRLFASSIVRGGFLWLGSRETVGHGEALGFEPFVRDQQIYGSRPRARAVRGA